MTTPESNKYELRADIVFTENMAARSMIETSSLMTGITLVLAIVFNASLQWIVMACGIVLLIRELHRRSLLENNSHHRIISGYMCNRISFFGAISGLGLASTQSEFTLPFVLGCTILTAFTIYSFGRRDDRMRISLLYAIQIIGTYLLIITST